MRKLTTVCVLLLPGCSTVTTTTTITKSLHAKSVFCHARDNGNLPDHSCTPGVIDPHVTQQNIHKTICVSGYTRTVRPASKLTNSLKIRQIMLYGYTGPAANPRNIEEDHLISLELGGAPSDTKNLWPEFPKSPNPKDKIENLLHKLVCSGAMKLHTAQQLISHNWMGVH